MNRCFHYTKIFASCLIVSFSLSLYGSLPKQLMKSAPYLFNKTSQLQLLQPMRLPTTSLPFSASPNTFNLANIPVSDNMFVNFTKQAQKNKFPSHLIAPGPLLVASIIGLSYFPGTRKILSSAASAVVSTQLFQMLMPGALLALAGKYLHNKQKDKKNNKIEITVNTTQLK